MSQHKYAFKFRGKTLGIRDVDQLVRLIEAGKLTPSDKVFLLSSKRWEVISSLPEFVAANTVTPEMKAGEYAGITGRDMTGLIGQALKDESVVGSDESDDRSDYIFDSGRTIRASRDTQERRARRTETLVAARKPNPEGSDNRKAAVFTAILVLLLGMAVGFFGAFEISESVVPPGDTIMLQANQAAQSSTQHD
jgi:hypothetical protein